MYIINIVIVVVVLTLGLRTQSNDHPGHHVLVYQTDTAVVSTM